MLKIGDFSKLSRVSIRMLRHYDDIGLLKPAEIDEFTGYRYYQEEQLFIMGRITWENIWHCFQSPAGIISLIVGAGVAIFGYLGVDYMKASPEVATALIIGTMIGVFFFKGVPVGPLIASGVVYVIMSIAQKFMGD